MNKFEQLIEYVINDEEGKARELFHDIVVEKSRAIYEEMMEDDLEEDIQDVEEGQLGGDQADDLIDDVETEEQGISMEGKDEGDMDAKFDDEAEEAGDDLTHGIEGEHNEEDLEDRVVDLEDKLDELMAEFEALMDGDDMGDMGMDDGMSDIEVADDELETEDMFNENIDLKAAPAPVKSEEGNINKKAVYAANSGARGAVAKPVSAGTNEGGHHDSSAYKNATKDLIGKVQNTPAQSTVKLSPATKPHLAQATGVNTKSITR